MVENNRELVVVRKLYMVRRNSEAVDLEVEVHVLSSSAERKRELGCHVGRHVGRNCHAGHHVGENRSRIPPRG